MLGAKTVILAYLSKDAATGTTWIAYHNFWQVAGARVKGPLVADPLSEIAVLVVSHTQVVVASVIVVVPVLQTSAPIENALGPVAGALESRPTTFHSIGVIDKLGPAACATPESGSDRTSTRAASKLDERGKAAVIPHHRHLDSTLERPISENSGQP